MTTQDPELSAALGWPGGISDPVLDRKVLLQMVAAMRLASRQALEAICGAKLCEVNSMSSRHEMVRLMDEAITALRAVLAQQDELDHETRAELAEQQVVQLAEERDHYRNLWQKAQQDEPAQDSGFWGRVAARQASRIKQLETAAQQALEALDAGVPISPKSILHDWFRAALAQQAEPTVKESLQVPAEVAATITTTDIAWLATCRLTKLWQELGQMRWAGSDEGWDRAIEAVRSRLNDECQAVLNWKTMADQSNATAIELLQKMQGLKDE